MEAVTVVVEAEVVVVVSYSSAYYETAPKKKKKKEMGENLRQVAHLGAEKTKSVVASSQILHSHLSRWSCGLLHFPGKTRHITRWFACLKVK